ncbi:MAG: hypothetical protein ACP5HM_03790 [Anaerolineae bacterium]
MKTETPPVTYEAAFNDLRAEAEPWLSACFVPPPGFERILAPRSIIVFGGPGSGKTALYRELRRRSHTTEGHPLRLLVDWRPAPLPPGVEANLGWVRRQVFEIFDKCAKALVGHLAAHPTDYREAPDWVKTRLRWFICRFLHGDARLRLEPLTQQYPQGAEVINDLLEAPVKDVLHDDADPDQILAELVTTLHGIELDGIWIMSDGLAGWAPVDTEHVVRGLGAFLSTLALFEQAGLIYKLWAPTHLAPILSHAGGIARRRLDSMHLRWDTGSLRRVVERRLALVLDKEKVSLEALCASPEFLPWLKKAGGHSPRHWLDQVAPLARHAVRQNRLPIDETTWLTLREEHPPRLYLDEQARRILVGGRDIDLSKVPAKAYAMLRYLYQRADEVIPKKELYYLGYRELKRIPAQHEEKYEDTHNYEGVIDTNLWRLRKAIEPDPSHPVLLETVRGYGIRLHVRW